MPDSAPFSLKNRNPDVLTCIANLSNDEVFTPPAFANQMLDSLTEAWSRSNAGADIWSDSTVSFLDPFTKSGVFLREIVQRLTVGLEKTIPDLQQRVNHIVQNQVFGIGITELTSQLARRSVYCSKAANGPHSIGSEVFSSAAGNIWFESIEHSWTGGRNSTIASNRGTRIRTVGAKCRYCGASKSELDRGAGLESHAYALIHTDNPQELVGEIFGGNMQFDVIIGNPPYQLNTEGFGTQARPIYHQFVNQAKALDPKFLSMVIPARWFSGGMGLDDFRAEMISDNRIRIIEDFPDSNDVFLGTQIKGGVCFFLWDRDNRGECSVTTHEKSLESHSISRPLLEPGLDVFIRYNQAIPILKKVMQKENSQDLGMLTLPEESRFIDLVSSIGAFGLDTTFKGDAAPSKGAIKVYRNGGIGFIPRRDITKCTEAIDQWKVFIPRAGSGSDSFPHPILGKPFAGEPGSISSWTYMHIGPFRDEREVANAITYIRTRFFRFLVLLHKPSQDATRGVYTFVPKQDFSVSWNDQMLYAKYGITDNEIKFIESLIRPMELGDE